MYGNWTASDWSRGAGATLVGNSQVLKSVKDFTNDSRKVGDRSLFVALKGENVDGHEFVLSSLNAGVLGALVSQKWFQEQNLDMGKFPQSCLLVVRDPLWALNDLAAFRISKDLSQVKRIGITGSNGKTTTKEIVKTLLVAGGKKVFATEGNFNSEIGLPIMVLKTPRDTEYAIYEMGMNHGGEMDLLVRSCRPDLGVVTNVGRAHVGLLGSQDAIAFEKRKVLYTASHAVIWAQDPYKDFLLGGFSGTVSTFTSTSLEKMTNLGLEGYAFQHRGQDFHIPLPGRHNLENALAALEVGEWAGLSWTVLAQGLAQVVPSFGRSEIIHGPITIIQDCYNANLDSMEGLIEFFADIPWPQGRKFLVLGSMKELGSETETHHRQLGNLAAGSGAGGIWFFGDETRISYEACLKAGTPAQWFISMDEMILDVKKVLVPGDLLAVKGSRGVELERLIKKIKQEGLD